MSDLLAKGGGKGQTHGTTRCSLPEAEYGTVYTNDTPEDIICGYFI